MVKHIQKMRQLGQSSLILKCRVEDIKGFQFYNMPLFIFYLKYWLWKYRLLGPIRCILNILYDSLKTFFILGTPSLSFSEKFVNPVLLFKPLFRWNNNTDQKPRQEIITLWKFYHHSKNYCPCLLSLHWIAESYMIH